MRLVVERPIDLEQRAGRRDVRVLEVEDLAGQRNVPRHARVRERQARGPERDLHRVALGEGEPQRPGAIGVLFHEVERAGVAPRDLPRLGEDRLDQVTRVALGREPDADRVQLG